MNVSVCVLADTGCYYFLFSPFQKANWLLFASSTTTEVYLHFMNFLLIPKPWVNFRLNHICYLLVRLFSNNNDEDTFPLK